MSENLSSAVPGREGVRRTRGDRGGGDINLVGEKTAGGDLTEAGGDWGGGDINLVRENTAGGDLTVAGGDLTPGDSLADCGGEAILDGGDWRVREETKVLAGDAIIL